MNRPFVPQPPESDAAATGKRGKPPLMKRKGRGRKGKAEPDTAPPPPAPPAADAAERYFNRELSWLAFNERVLCSATDMAFPLLERVRFLAISGSNLDEFLMIRVAGLVGQARRGISRPGLDGRSPAQQLAVVSEQLAHLTTRQQEVWQDLRGELKAAGIRVPEGDEVLAPPRRDELRNRFERAILPVLTPQAIDPAHPFPFVGNGGTGVLFRLRRDEDEELLQAMVLLPAALPRFERVEDEAGVLFLPLPRLLMLCADLLFPGFTVLGSGVFRVLRDSDIEIEEEAEDLVRTFRSAIQRRRRGDIIQLELQAGFDPEAESVLRDKLGITPATIVRMAPVIGFAGLAEICSEDRPELLFEPFSPRYPERILEHDGDAFAAIREKDIVIHHPYESFEVVVDFIRQAAADPDVVAIKQTLYRAGNQSAVIAALIAAAEAGKSVTAVVELKARFDEEQNLKWASELERAGVQVIYGFVDWKTHAKVAMVVRREDNDYRTYCHFGTGNYHPQTARIYTDLSFFTADPALGRDAAKLFNFVTGYVEPRDTQMLSIAPVNLRETLYSHIDAEIDHAKAGRPSGIWFKCNQITDQGIIDRLYAASAAGVEVAIVCRGICSLRPGVPGLSDRIKVKSIIGRFLEHSRIYAFGNGHRLPHRNAALFIASADLMGRNFDRRVEALIPITNRTVHDQVLQQVLLANMLDTELSWWLAPDGSYGRTPPEGTQSGQAFNCHRYFMTNPSLSGRGGALEEGGVPRLVLRRGRA